MNDLKYFDRNVMASVCRSVNGGGGHIIASLQTDVAVHPSTGQLLPQFTIICTRCGATLQDINEDIRVRRGATGKRRPRGTAAEPALSSPPPIGNTVGVEEELS